MTSYFHRLKTCRISAETLSYLAIGALQFLIDIVIFFALVHYQLLEVGVANVASRLLAATLGFWLNHKYTFAGTGREVAGRWLRFWCWWWSATFLGSFLLNCTERVVDEDVILVVTKLAIEVCLVFLTFQVFRRWVYR
jgi:putative flippase GtrA